MNLEPFALERYFAQYEFSVPYLLSSSDCDGWPMHEILDLADAQALELWRSLRLGYTDSLGHPLLRPASCPGPGRGPTIARARRAWRSPRTVVATCGHQRRFWGRA